MTEFAPDRSQATDAAFPGTSRRREWLFLSLVVVACGWLYYWSALLYPNVAMSSAPNGYYGLLTAGFRTGHLYAAIEPNPALLALKDPYDPVANAPYRVHDMTLWKGKYYLYYGVTPVLLLFWPVVELTGFYPSEPLAVASFTFGGFCLGVALLCAMRRRYYPRAPGWILVLGALCLGFATPVSLLNQATQFYQVPIACAFFLLMLMLGAIWHALHSRFGPVFGVAAASLLLGLAVGARPNYLLEGVTLAVPLVWLLLGPGRTTNAGTSRALRLLLAATVPVGLCGVGLIVYNWLRFGSPTEFGMHYQLAGERVLTLKPMALGNLWPHVRLYLFNPGLWGPYFPFFSPPSAEPQGMLRFEPWLYLALFAYLPRPIYAAGPRDGRMTFTVAVFFATAANLVMLASFYGMAERYPCDFTPAWLLLAGMGALALTQGATRPAWRWRWVKTAIAVAAGISLFTSLAVFARGVGPNGKLLWLARVGNWPAYVWQKAHGQEFGALTLALELPVGRTGPSEPLFQTGRAADQRDWLSIEYLPNNRARLGFFHAGLGQLNGLEFPIPADRRIVVEARCGSLLPPFAHPIFSTWTRDASDVAHRDLEVKVNGKETLRAVLECYDSTPRDLRIGALDWVSGGFTARFSGRVLGVARLPLVRSDPPPALRERLPVELTLLFPVDRLGGAEPLLETGRGTKSDLLYCRYVSPTELKFGVDHFGNGGPESESVTYDPLQPHQLTLWMGSLADPTVAGPAGEPKPWSERLVVLFDGRAVLNVEQPFFPANPETVIIGFNSQGSTVTPRKFFGHILDVRTVAFQALPPLVLNNEYGALDLTVMFPLHFPGAADPLAETGVTGKGDLLYVRYLDANHVSFGFDHWGVGGIVSPPVEIDYSVSHRLELSMGSLYPSNVSKELRTLVRVRLDGKTVLNGESPCHPTTVGQIRLFSNPIGASTCGPMFNGKLISIERLAAPRP